MKCQICSLESQRVFTKSVLGKINVTYYRCSYCFFLQTEEPYWLEESYGRGAINALDVGVLSRNLTLIKATEKIISHLFLNNSDLMGLDYGGGHGIFVRLMRDKGFNFFRQDLYAENIFAQFFDVEDLLPEKRKFDFLTAFEVFEHLPSPIEEIEKMFSYSDIIFFSTELQPSIDLEILKNWWYLVPEGGQHVSFYHSRTFEEIAQKLQVTYYSNSVNLHILSKIKFDKNPLENDVLQKKFWLKDLLSKINLIFKKQDILQKQESLIMKDFEFVKQQIRSVYGS